jgi:hypothetical protein
MTKRDTGVVNIHGKEYKTVALRVSEFREGYSIDDGWGIETQCYAVDAQTVIMRAIITDPEGRLVATGYAEEERTQRGINSTSALENAETSAIGRALAGAGYAGTEYASADEVAQAISKQAERPASSPSGAPTEKQKNYLWKLIKEQPESEQAALTEEAKEKANDRIAISNMIERLKK